MIRDNANLERLLATTRAFVRDVAIPNEGRVDQCENDLPADILSQMRELGSCLALTEPEAGSDATAMTAHGKRQPDGTYLLSGHKRYITLAPIGEVFLDRCPAHEHTIVGGAPGRGFRTVMKTQNKHVAGIDVVAVPYTGSPPQIPVLITGQLSAAYLSAALTMPQARSGRLKALARAGDRHEGGMKARSRTG